MGAFLVLMLFVSCRVERDKGIITCAVSQEPVTLDIMTNPTLSGRLVASGNIYEKLLVTDGEGRIREELASGYFFSDDNHTLTFTLRDDVCFHDGKIMTAEDVCASMNRYLSLYQKASDIAAGAEFVIVDDLTVSITSEKSLLFLPYLIASSPQEAIVMPSYLIDGTKLVTKIIGTGPYKLVQWNPGEKIVLDAFSQYSRYGTSSSGRWGNKKAENSGITFFFVPDSVTRLIGLENGEFDFINDVMSSDFHRLEENGDIRLIHDDGSGSIALVFNKKEGVMKDREIRRAVSYALSSDLLMASCYGTSSYTTDSSYMEKRQKEWNVSSPGPFEVRNREEAMRILEDRNVGTIRILSSNLSNLDRIAAVLKEQLEEVSLECEITILDWASFIEERNYPDRWDIYISAFTAVPLPQMKSYLSPSFPGWADENDDALSVIRELEEASDIEEACRIWKKGQKILWEYAPVYIAGHYSTTYACSRETEGVIIQNGFFFWRCKREQM